MSRDETVKLVCQNLGQALVLLDELGETLAAAHLQGVLDTIEAKQRSRHLPKKSSVRRNDHDAA